MADNDVKGLPQLLRAMQQLPAEIVSKNGGPLKRALFAAAKVIKEEAARLAPRRTGFLSTQLAVYRDRNPADAEGSHFGLASQGATERYLIGVRRRKKRYGNNKKNRQKERVGEAFKTEDAFYWRFLEFGTDRAAAKPFMRPAFEAKKHEAVARFVEVLRKGVQAAVRKVARMNLK